MTIKIGHASADENTKAKGGKAGDQTGREVVIQDWYLRTGGWTEVFRAKDSNIAEKIAKAMEQACLNDNIGYDQGQRTTLYEKVKTLNWNLSKVKEKCECDCTSLVAVCVNAAGVKVSRDMYIGNQKVVLHNTGKFETLTDSKYLIKPDHLKRGDILLGPGHTAIVVSVSNTLEKAKSFNKDFAGIYKVNATKLNVRLGAGADKQILTTIPKGTEVKCYGFYTRLAGVDWLYVQFTCKDISYTGFTSIKYLTK
jgi:hypothetical protein